MSDIYDQHFQCNIHDAQGVVYSRTKHEITGCPFCLTAEIEQQIEWLCWIWASVHQDVSNDQIREYLRPKLAKLSETTKSSALPRSPINTTKGHPDYLKVPKEVECHADGDTCHGCDHYHGKAELCRYHPDSLPDKDTDNFGISQAADDAGDRLVNEIRGTGKIKPLTRKLSENGK